MTIQVYASQSLDYFNSIGKYSLASALKFLPETTTVFLTTEDVSRRGFCLSHHECYGWEEICGKETCQVLQNYL